MIVGVKQLWLFLPFWTPDLNVHQLKTIVFVADYKLLVSEEHEVFTVFIPSYPLGFMILKSDSLSPRQALFTYKVSEA